METGSQPAYSAHFSAGDVQKGQVFGHGIHLVRRNIFTFARW
jgi:hypothetical protein